MALFSTSVVRFTIPNPVPSSAEGKTPNSGTLHSAAIRVANTSFTLKLNARQIGKMLGSDEEAATRVGTVTRFFDFFRKMVRFRTKAESLRILYKNIHDDYTEATNNHEKVSHYFDNLVKFVNPADQSRLRISKTPAYSQDIAIDGIICYLDDNPVYSAHDLGKGVRADRFFAHRQRFEFDKDGEMAKLPFWTEEQRRQGHS